MAAIETVATSLNGNFKNVYGDKIMDLVPESDILYRNDRIKFVSKKGREGLQFNQPVLLSLPSSATWGLNGPTLNAPIAMQMGNATVTGSAITMRDVLSYDSAARAASSEAAFEGTVGLVLRTLFKAHAKFAEMDLIYGNGAIASAGTAATPSMFQSASSTQAGGSGTNVTITVSYGSWAPAMLSGFQNAALDCYNAGSKVNTNAALQIVSINPTPANNTVGGTVVLTGNATDLNAVQALTASTLDFYWYGAYANNMVGIKGILTNTGSLFGINAATYDLWQSNTFDCASTQLTFSKLQQSVALSVARGLDENVMALVNPVTFADLVNEQAGARRYDSSYAAKKNENGSEALTYWGPSGKIEVVPHMFVHQGEGFVIPPSDLVKVGPLDHISPTLPGIDGDIFFQSPTQASYEVRLFSDFGLLNNMPARSTWIKAITNSVSA
jgi:hypothetical protein